MNDQLDTVRSIMKDVRVAMVTTADERGHLTSRPMAVQETDFDGDAWFFVARDSDVAREVAAHPGVNVSYAGSSSWLSLSGRAETVVDAGKKAELWNSFVDAWFPGGKDDPGVVLLKVNGETAQYWDSPGKLASMIDMVRAKATGTQAGEVGESGTVEL